MHMVRRMLLTAGIAAALVAAGIAGTSAFATTTGLARPNAVSMPTATPGSFKSNEATAHEAGESAGQEAAENSGKRLGAGPGGCHAPNEDAAHEKSESAAREAAEGTAKCPTTTPSGTVTR